MAIARTNAPPPATARNLRTMVALALLVAAMTGLAFASVPLYRLFCQVTGFGGTTQVADAPAERVLDRTVNLRFLGQTHPSLDWRLRAPAGRHPIRLGEVITVAYTAENTGTEPVVGTATYNVTPDKAGLYFGKLECFCFTEQLLQPGERAELPVQFYLDPALAEDENLDGVTSVTLSYTFFRAHDQSAAGAASE